MVAPPDRIDVEAAVIDHLRRHLVDRGYPHGDLDDLRDLAIRSANADFRKIAAVPRTWTLPKIPLTFDPMLQQGVDRLRQAVAAGADLTPFQSTSRLDPNFNDHLFSDWGIHHFHLGINQHPLHPEFVGRTGPVLFAFPTQDRFLVIGIDEHGAWTDPQLLEVLHENWPEELSRYRHFGAQASALTNAEEIKNFRKHGVNGAVRLADGTVYTCLNSGRAGDGTPVTVVMAANDLVRTVRQLQKHIDERLQTMAEIVEQKRGLETAKQQFKFVMVREGENRQPGYYLDEQMTGYSFHLQSPPT